MLRYNDCATQVSRSRAARDIIRRDGSGLSSTAMESERREIDNISSVEQSSDPELDEKWVHQADGWMLFMCIHIVLSGITVMLFSVAYLSSATFTNGWSTFVSAYVLVSFGFATVSLAAIITAFQDFITVIRAIADRSVVKKIEVKRLLWLYFR